MQKREVVSRVKRASAHKNPRLPTLRFFLMPIYWHINDIRYKKKVTILSQPRMAAPVRNRQPGEGGLGHPSLRFAEDLPPLR